MKLNTPLQKAMFKAIMSLPEPFDYLAIWNAIPEKDRPEGARPFDVSYQLQSWCCKSKTSRSLERVRSGNHTGQQVVGGQTSLFKKTERFREYSPKTNPDKLERYERPEVSPIESAWDKWKADNLTSADNPEDKPSDEL